MSVLDFCDVIYMHASSSRLHAVYNRALIFITKFKPLTHHCLLYSSVACSDFSIRILRQWHILIYKANNKNNQKFMFLVR